ncbi:DUF4340 domain-containing protein [Brunnivagina elsteri]|uniref:DUF4340 domain-containing protein n=1 Tax=Brunnivagina elsteri CCALA 953 TaxID=987040 RepID=A0A2A2TK61_9CYAN|nr:DUF4340 domain-containing protein [Calothrix elsteri]PAX55891.1 hypothetical protein CK510_10785 [Calothrix elsteri CCALA 953]
MKLQRTTLMLILLALGLGGIVYFCEMRNGNQAKESQANKQKIFDFAADDVRSLNIKTNNLNITIDRSTNPNPPKWLLKSPVSVPASDASVSFLMDLLIKGTSDRIISVSSNQLNEFGLNQPVATIDIQLKNQKTHRLILGKSDFNDRFLYAQANPSNKPDGKTEVLLVSKEFVNAVSRELSEWQQTADNQLQNSTPLPLPTFTPPIKVSP